MLARRNFIFRLKDLTFTKLTSFSLILFFILLGDAILSYWVPNFLQDSLGNAFLMGIVMGFSSVVGLVSDLVFPQILRNATVGRILYYAIFTSILFIVCLALGVAMPIIIVFLVAMAIWGVYYEFLHFAQQQFVADSIPLESRSSGWAIIGTFKSVAYFLGPILAGLLLAKGEYSLLMIAAGFVLIGLLIFFINEGKHRKKISIEVHEVSIFKEFSHWMTLLTRVWPVVLLSLFMGLVDATFWTTGAVWSGDLAKESFWGNLVLPAYQLPLILIGVILSKWKVYKGKKKLAEIYLFLSGFVLTFMAFELPIAAYIVIIFLASSLLSIAYPLVEAVYSDITARMGVERKHLVGLSASTISLAYIVGPAFSGYIANIVGERETFAIIGSVVLVVSGILLFITPKKILLPEKEIKEWSS